VALGRALLRDPVAFLLDEPLSNLDAKLRTGMRTELIKLHRRVGRTIIHVTHDQVEAMTMAERICIMKDGRVVQIGPPMAVYRDPADTFVAGFLASPPMNLVPARLESGPDGLDVVASGLRAPLGAAASSAIAAKADSEVILGLRPEEVTLQPDGKATAPLAVVTLAVEALGPETILVGNLGDERGPDVSLRMPRDFTATVGQRVPLWIDPMSLRLFDPATNRAIPLPAGR
jgi:multiple sugar transport system ATP-binding protein